MEANNNSGSQSNKAAVVSAAVIAALIIYLIITMSGKGSARGKNIKVLDTNDYMVRFSAVCPKCKHQNSPHFIELSKGESTKDYAICGNCGEAFEITVNR